MLYKYNIGIYVRNINTFLILGFVLMIINNLTLKNFWGYITILAMTFIFSLPQILAIFQSKELSVTVNREEIILHMDGVNLSTKWDDVTSVAIDEKNYVYIKCSEGLIPISCHMENIGQMIEEIKDICKEREIDIRRAIVLT